VLEVTKTDAAKTIALATGGRDFQPSSSSWAEAARALGDVVLLVEGEAVGFDRFIRDAAIRASVSV